MKLITLTLFVLYSISAFAEWRLPRFNFGDNSNGGLRTVWSCPVNRGEMPELKEVEIYYTPEGQIAFRPDIFRGRFNPINALKSLFGRRRSAENVDECLRSFMNTIPQAVANYQQARCSGSSDLVCTRSAQDISLDAGRKIRTSSFYDKYQSELASVQDILPATVVVDTPVTPITPEVPETPITPIVPEVPETPITPVITDTTPEVIKTATESIVPRPEENPDRSRTRVLDYMIDNFDKFEEIKEFAKHCPQMGSTPGDNALYCSQRHQKHNSFLTNLSQMFTALRGEPMSQSRLLQSIECLPPNVGEFRDLEDILNKMDEKDECHPLANVGDHKLFRKASGGDPAWYTSGDYLLKKTASDTYEATLNLNFTDNGGAITSQQMLSKVQGCLAEANPYMRGPGGAKLNIRALSPAQIEAQLPRSERPLPGTIRVIPDQVRNASGTMVNNEIDAANFHSQIDCPTVMHEVLHHLGLCDEYRESRTNIVPGLTRSRAEEWSCRVVPTAPSIMKNQNEVYNGAIPQQFSCECVNDGCRNAMRSNDSRSIAQRQLLMSASSHDVLGSLSAYCANPVYLPTVDVVPEPEKAFTGVQFQAGVLKFQNRSLMSDNGIFKFSRKEVTCSCPAGDVNCPAALADAALRIASNPEIKECPLHTQRSSEKGLASLGATTSITSNGFTMVTTPTMPSLISPNHFDKILSGNCRQGPSAVYKKCAEYSYTAQDSTSCSQKPAECNDDNQYLGRGSEQ